MAKYGVVNYEISCASGRREKLHLVDRLVPFSVLRVRKLLGRARS
jgi:hypothetical protein